MRPLDVRRAPVSHFLAAPSLPPSSRRRQPRRARRVTATLYAVPPQHGAPGAAAAGGGDGIETAGMGETAGASSAPPSPDGVADGDAGGAGMDGGAADVVVDDAISGGRGRVAATA